MGKSFDPDELRILCSDLELEIEYEELKGKNRLSKADSLISYFDRRGDLSSLVDVLKEKRPNVDWKEAIKTEGSELYGLRPISIPTIVAAMKRNEAEELCEEQKEDMQRILRFEQLEAMQVIERYDKGSRDRWRPFGANGDSVRAMLEDFSEERFIKGAGSGDSRAVGFQFFSDLFFAVEETKETEARQVRRNVQDKGYVLIVDEISLLHESILDGVSTILSAKEPNALFFVSPKDFSEQKLDEWLGEYINECYSHFFVQYRRLYSYYDFLIGSKTRLYRSLKTGLGELYLDNRLPSPWDMYWMRSLS
jgi:hypothetical protein